MSSVTSVAALVYSIVSSTLNNQAAKFGNLLLSVAKSPETVEVFFGGKEVWAGRIDNAVMIPLRLNIERPQTLIINRTNVSENLGLTDNLRIEFADSCAR